MRKRVCPSRKSDDEAENEDYYSNIKTYQVKSRQTLDDAQTARLLKTTSRFPCTPPCIYVPNYDLAGAELQ